MQEQVAAFRRRADEAGVTLIDATHYGMEKPPQLAMVDWFRAAAWTPSSSPTGREWLVRSAFSPSAEVPWQ